MLPLLNQPKQAWNNILLEEGNSKLSYDQEFLCKGYVYTVFMFIPTNNVVPPSQAGVGRRHVMLGKQIGG